MPDPPTCSSCGAPLSDAGVAGGLCGGCLVRLAIETDSPSPASPTTESIGPYRLVEKIAEGGMGVVWRAEQIEPVRRTVAVKLIRPGLDSSQVLARFDAERQAMALMDHPGIARIHDAGATEDGRPYFVMEYVPGEPVTTYFDRRKLGTRDRIHLFLAICDAVQHAHHKGVVHRDLKPSNVLVAEKDGKPAIKVIDFGIAKATQHKLTDRTLVTQIGLAVGTPEYMSPEQASGNGLDVDTRTDVYSLGVLLYELLVGALPFDPEVLRRAAIEEVLKTIREVDPPRPSARIQTLGDASTTSASLRSTEPRTLEREIRGDLDWIAMKALEKDRNRRYGSPSELAADLRRHLAFEPVLAGPPSAAYRTRKFVRRQRVGVAITSAAAAALVVGMIGTTYGLIRATRAEKQAREHAATAERVSEFLVGLFEVNDPSEAKGKTITAREIFDKGAVKVEKELAEEPLVRARLLRTFGLVYMNLGFIDEAERLLRTAAGIEHDLGAGEAEAITLGILAACHFEGIRFEEAESTAARAVEIWGSLGIEDHLELAEALMILGGAQSNRGDVDAADRNLTRAAQIVRANPSASPRQRLRAVLWIAGLDWKRDRWDRFRPMIEAALADARAAGYGESVAALGAERFLAFDLRRTGRLEEAERAYRDVLARLNAVVGSDQKGQILDTLWDLASLLRDRRRYDEATRVGNRLVEACDRFPPPDRPETLAALMWTAETARRAGDPAGAVRWLEDARMRGTRDGRADPGIEAVVECRLALTRERDARVAVDRALEILEALPVDARPGLVQTLLLDLAAASAGVGQAEQAADCLRRALDRGASPKRVREFLRGPDGVALRDDRRIVALVEGAHGPEGSQSSR